MVAWVRGGGSSYTSGAAAAHPIWRLGIRRRRGELVAARRGLLQWDGGSAFGLAAWWA